MHAKTTISHIYDEGGNRVEDVDRIKKVAVGFYEKLLGSSSMIFFFLLKSMLFGLNI